tara:strand:+ start:146 stop:547 length:402 start_codon:yes stop_codon:yes gene_type:complete
MPYGKGSKRAGTKSGGGPHNPPFKFGGMLAANRAVRNKAQAKTQGSTAVAGQSGGGAFGAARGVMGAMGAMGGGRVNRSMRATGAFGGDGGRRKRSMGMLGGMAAGAGANRNASRSGGGFSAFFKHKRVGYAK